MNRVIVFISSMLVGAFLAGCAAMGVPATSDPDKKIAYAYILFDEQQRPLPAETLIREAIAIYRENNEELGLAEAYRAYGFFFRSASIEKLQKYYEPNGFMEQDATYANRYAKSIEYFEKAEELFKKNGKTDALTNVYLNMGFTYEFADQPDKACVQYGRSLASNREYVKEMPEILPTAPEGFDSVDAYLIAIMDRLKCAR